MISNVVTLVSFRMTAFQRYTVTSILTDGASIVPEYRNAYSDIRVVIR
jgi:hypothetical protein